MESSALTSILRAVPSVPTLAMRRAVIEQKVFAIAPSAAAGLLQALVERASEGDGRARLVTLALTSAIAHRRQSGDVQALDAVAEASRDAGFERAAELCGAAVATKSLAPRGKLPEVGLNKDVFFPSVPKLFDLRDDCSSREVYIPGPVHMRYLAAGFLGYGTQPLEQLRAHPDARFLSRVLKSRWIRQRDVLVAAARRPSTPAIAIAIASDDRWLLDPRVREALLENPFTPRWLVAALSLGSRPSQRVARSAEHAEPVAHDAP